MDIAIRQVRVLTLDPQAAEHDEADILITAGRIDRIGPGVAEAAPAGARVIDGRGKLAMPGLVNGHFHSPMNLIKGALDDMPLELYMLYEVPPLAETPVSAPVHMHQSSKPCFCMASGARRKSLICHLPAAAVA